MVIKWKEISKIAESSDPEDRHLAAPLLSLRVNNSSVRM